MFFQKATNKQVNKKANRQRKLEDAIKRKVIHYDHIT